MLDWLHFQISDALDDWLEALAVIGATVIAMGITRTLFLSGRAHKRWGYVARLSRSAVNLIAAVGFKLFVDVAPLNPTVEKYLVHAVYILVIVFVLAFFRRAALVTIEWSASRQLDSKALQQYGFIALLKNVLNLFVFFAGAIMILKHFGYDVLSLLTALGVGSLAVGLAAKDTLSNMISGFIIIIDRNLTPGDRIIVTGSSGTTAGDVEEIGLRSTRIKTGDGNTLIVPNSDLVNNRIFNMSEPSRETTTTATLRVPYSTAFAKVRGVCLSVLQRTPKVASSRGNAIVLTNIADGCQTVQISFWVTDMDAAGEALSFFYENVLTELSQAGVRLVEAAPGAVPQH